ncbi:SAM-dependent methyltransferase, partial [bacterium]|nr:SAM-dependent methyltransferase [bacterium]
IIEQAMEIKRVARPKMLENSNCVEVDYDMTIHDKTTGNVEEFAECHRIRYLFLPEIEEFLRQAGMELAFAHEWMSGKEPGLDTWGLCCGAVLSR